MTQPIVELDGVGKTYKQQRRALFKPSRLTVLNNVNLSVYPGEFIAVVGPSGSGKSTLAQIIVGLTEPTVGTVRFHGREVGREDIRRLAGRRQMVFQNPYRSLSPRLTVAEIIAEPAWIIGRKAPVEELLAQVGLDRGLAMRLPGRLSAGQRQRVAIARALSTDPELLVVDEPTSALDNITAAGINELIVGLKGRTAVIAVTHDEEHTRTADRIAEVSAGTLCCRDNLELKL